MDYVGRKMKGFEFKHLSHGVRWGDQYMAKKIGEIGVITYSFSASVIVQFEDGERWTYPLTLIEPHLIPLLPTRIEQEHSEMLEVLGRVVNLFKRGEYDNQDNIGSRLLNDCEQLIEKVNRP